MNTFTGLSDVLFFEMPDMVDDYADADVFCSNIDMCPLTFAQKWFIVQSGELPLFSREIYKFEYTFYHDGDMSVGIFGESCIVYSVIKLSEQDLETLRKLYADYFDFKTYVIGEDNGKTI